MLHQDQKLLAAYRDGATWAFETLYRAFSEPVRCFLARGFTFVSQGKTCFYRGGVAGVDAEGIVQETFARAFAPATRVHYDGERPFKNYLFSIAKNLVLRELQRLERVVPLEVHEDGPGSFARRRAGPPPALVSGARDPGDALEDGELHVVARAFIQTLDGEGRTFFLHRFVRGLTQEATAQAMHVTRARIKLLEKMQRRAFLEALRGAGYFLGYTPRPRWSRRAA